MPAFSDPALILPGAVGEDELASNAVTALKIKDGVITNDHIAALAAIVATKLTGFDIVNADVNAGAAIAKSKLASLDIVNADVNAGAAILVSKLSGVGLVAVDTYAGDASANRAIPHTLGSDYVGSIIQNITDGDIFFHLGATGTVISYQNGGGQGVRTVTASDGTNLYVGNAASYDQSANQTGKNYVWFAFGVN